MLAAFIQSFIITILIISFFVLYGSCFQTTHFPQDPPQRVQLVDAPKGSPGSSCSLTSPDDPLPPSGCQPPEEGSQAMCVL